MGLKIIAVRSPFLASPSYKMSSKSNNRFKSCWEGQAGDLISLLFIFGKQTETKQNNFWIIIQKEDGDRDDHLRDS
jgi:hypothetical protein